jgi:hypothetical protein
MDKETQIVAALRKNIPSSQSETATPLVEEPKKISSEILSKPNKYENDIAAYRLMDYFEVPMSDRKDRTTTDKLNYIYQWAIDMNNSDDNVDVMSYIREQENRLGISLKENKLNSLYQWIKLDKERRRVEKEMSLWQK